MLYGSVDSWAWGPLTVLLLLASLWALSQQVRRRQAILWPIWFLPVAAFGIEALLQWAIPLSIYRSPTLTGLLQLCGMAAMLQLAAVAFRRPQSLSALALWAWGFLGALSLEAITQYYLSPGKIFWFHNAQYGSPLGPYVNRDDYAGLVELLLPLAIAFAFTSFKEQSAGAKSLIRALSPAFAFASVVMSSSRAGIAISLAEILVCLVYLGYGTRKRSRLGRWTFAAMLAGIIVSFSSLISWQPIMQRFHSLADPYRWSVTVACLRICRDHLVWGTGFGTFQWAYPKYQTFDIGLIWTHAHNEYAQVLAEMGLVGAACVIAFIVLYTVSSIRVLRQPRPGDGVLRGAALIGTIALMLHSLVDFQFHIPANAWVFFLLAAAAATPPAKGENDGSRKKAQVNDLKNSSRMNFESRVQYPGA